MKRLSGIASLLSALAVTTLSVSSVHAGEFTDVIDAADMRQNKDPFDLNIKIGYLRTQEKGKITRETFSKEPHSWDYYAKYEIATFDQVQNILDLQLDIGLFRDVSFRFGVPIILSDDRSLNTKEGWPEDGSETPLFDTSFRSPQRSGIDYLSAALWWGILDQGRIKEYPYLTIFVEGRFGVGAALKAACTGDNYEYNNCADTGDGGISRNLNELKGGLRFSRRYGVIEPYMGIDAMVGWYKNQGFEFEGGALNDMPPLEGTFDFGLEIVPWEVPSEFRKFVITVGGGARYVTEGRAYTPLFDALGTSIYFEDNADLDHDGSTSGDLEEAALASWTGMTDVENYGEFYGKLILTIQPAKYVKFDLGFDMGHQSEHFITKTDQCPAGSVDENGNCEYNPGHRPEIDQPGTRFRVENTLIWNLLLNATAQF